MFIPKHPPMSNGQNPNPHHPSFFTLNLTPSILHSQSYTLHSSLCILQLSALQQRSEFDIKETLHVYLYVLVCLLFDVPHLVCPQICIELRNSRSLLV